MNHRFIKQWLLRSWSSIMTDWLFSATIYYTGMLQWMRRVTGSVFWWPLQLRVMYDFGTISQVISDANHNGNEVTISNISNLGKYVNFISDQVKIYLKMCRNIFSSPPHLTSKPPTCSYFHTTWWPFHSTWQITLHWSVYRSWCSCAL